MKHYLAVLLSIALLSGQTDYARQDALVFKAAYFMPLDTLTMAQFWRETALRSESIYNGDGSWGLGYADWPTRPYDADHPLVRVVARHALGLLLLMENGLADSSAMRRTKLSLNWLIQRQTPEGAWPLYTVNRGVVSKFSLYPTALAGRALSRGYQVLDNPRYQLAAARALEWQAVRPETNSPFHHGLVLGALLAQYNALPDQDLLEQAVVLGLNLLGSQLPNGSWSDPTPLHTDEHAIITAALLDLEETMVRVHPHRRRITAMATGALNYLLENQTEDGNYVTGHDESRAAKVPTFELALLVKARKVRGMSEFDLPITGAIRAMNGHPSWQGNLWRGSQDGRFYGMAHALVWFVTTQTGIPRPRTKELKLATHASLADSVTRPTIDSKQAPVTPDTSMPAADTLSTILPMPDTTAVETSTSATSATDTLLTPTDTLSGALPMPDATAMEISTPAASATDTLASPTDSLPGDVKTEEP